MCEEEGNFCISQGSTIRLKGLTVIVNAICVHVPVFNVRKENLTYELVGFDASHVMRELLAKNKVMLVSKFSGDTRNSIAMSVEGKHYLLPSGMTKDELKILAYDLKTECIVDTFNQCVLLTPLDVIEFK